MFYGIRSERQLMEQLNYNLMYRWFVGLSPDDPVWDPTTFTKNRDRLQNGEVFAKFMTKLLNHPQVKPLLSDEHFSVDGTLIDSITATGKRRQSAIDGRTTRHKGYGLSQSCRAMIECIFGWANLRRQKDRKSTTLHVLHRTAKARRRLLALKGHSPECFLGDAKLKATGCHKKEKNPRQSTRLGVY